MNKCLYLRYFGYSKVRELIVREQYARKVFVSVFVTQTNEEVDDPVNIKILKNIRRKSSGGFYLSAVLKNTAVKVSCDLFSLII